MNAGKRDRLDPLTGSGIWPKEIEKARKRVKIGEPVAVLGYNRLKPNAINSYGCPVKTHVAKKYPHLVYLDNGMSITYAQLALYYRARKEGYVK